MEKCFDIVLTNQTEIKKVKITNNRFWVNNNLFDALRDCLKLICNNLANGNSKVSTRLNGYIVLGWLTQSRYVGPVFFVGHIQFKQATLDSDVIKFKKNLLVLRIKVTEKTP